MKQVVLRNGQPAVVEVPSPSPAPGRVLVANAASVISSGTERSAVSSSGGGSLPMRAIRNPQLVLTTLDHARKHGIRETAELVRGAVGNDIALGYSSAGVVVDSGGIGDFQPGQRVACAGAGYANHAEFVSVPGNLVVSVPDEVSLRDAAFTTLGAIAMQGVRRAEPALGERVAVIGLGLLGLLSVQILRAAGCQVVGVEPQASRRDLARELGAELVLAPDDAVAEVRRWSTNVGVDVAVVTAGSQSSAIINSAVEMVRRKGRVVPVGAVGLELDRPALYQREADLLISTSYGPGRYDRSYEELGIDYPLPYVRWTENRNMEEFLRLLSDGSVQVGALVEVDVAAEDAPKAYAAVRSESPPLAAVLSYTQEDVRPSPLLRIGGPAPSDAGRIVAALVGAGGFVRGMHLPKLKSATDVTIKTVVTRRGLAASDVARSIGGAQAGTDWRAVIDDDEIGLVVIGTRHDTHAEIAAAALSAGKAVFVEKPLGLTREEIDSVWMAGSANPRLTIGFNRPFAPLARTLAEEVAAVAGPLQLVYRVSAPLPAEHWLNDPVEGGGRILGEACHMFDFANSHCGNPRRVTAMALPARAGVPTVESASVLIAYEGGSVATVHYSGVGAPSMPKERVEVLRGGRSWVLDDFNSLTRFEGQSQQTETGKAQDKGHGALLERVLAACRGEAPWKPGLAEAYTAQSVALGALESIASGAPVEVVAPDAALPLAGSEIEARR